MAQKPRRFTDEERAELARLWPTNLPDKELVFRFGRHRGSLHREAARIGLKPRRYLRSLASEAAE